MTGLCLATAVLCLQGFELMEEGKDCITNKDMGFFLMKPWKSEQWEMRTKGVRLENALAAVVFKAKDVSIEVAAEAAKPGVDLKKAADALVKELKESESHKECKVKWSARKEFASKKTKEKAYSLDLQLTDAEQKKVVWRVWIFQSSKNDNLFKVAITGSEEDLKELAKDIDSIIGEFETKPVKKK